MKMLLETDWLPSVWDDLSLMHSNSWWCTGASEVIVKWLWATDSDPQCSPTRTPGLDKSINQKCSNCNPPPSFSRGSSFFLSSPLVPFIACCLSTWTFKSIPFSGLVLIFHRLPSNLSGSSLTELSFFSSAMGWMFLSSQKPYVEALTPRRWYLEVGLWEVISVQWDPEAEAP